MSTTSFAPLDITPMWARVNDELIELLGLLPDDKLDWSPNPELWNSRGILIHICFGRFGMMGLILQDGKPMPDIIGEGQTKEGLITLLRGSWQRMAPFLSNTELLEREYTVPFRNIEPATFSGHWLAFGQLEHDIHHRADIYRYLGELGIAHGEPDSLERKARVR